MPVWLAALEARHLSDLRVAEVSRALRALSSAYVERRARIQQGGALDSAGKRAAFALFYGPLHFLTVRAIVRGLDAARPPLATVVDLGCGTGVAGAAWARECQPAARAFGIELHPWAAAEARWTWATLGVEGSVRRADLASVRLPHAAQGVIAAFTLNELPGATRTALLATLLDLAAAGSRVLIVEPIAKRALPWWGETAAAVRAAGGREDEWRMTEVLPDIVRRLDRAAGLRHETLTARSLYIEPR